MASKILFNKRLLTSSFSKHATRTRYSFTTLPSARPFQSSATMSVTVDSHFISQITAAEKQLTNQDEPVKGGPTAMAQKHVGQTLTSAVIHDITAGEKVITQSDEPVAGGPTALAQSALTGGSGSANSAAGNPTSNASGSGPAHMTGGSGGVINSDVLHEITEKEKNLTGEARPIKGGPTAQAQKHVGETINSDTLHDITEGEKKVTGGERVKGGPTSTAQSELAKSRQQ